MLIFEGKMLFTLSWYLFPGQSTLKVKIQQRGSVLEHRFYHTFVNIVWMHCGHSLKYMQVCLGWNDPVWFFVDPFLKDMKTYIWTKSGKSIEVFLEMSLQEIRPHFDGENRTTFRIEIEAWTALPFSLNLDLGKKI